MMKFGIIAGALCTLVLAKLAAPLPGYYALPGVDISTDTHHPLCDQNPDSNPIPSAAGMAVCDAINCQVFNTGSSAGAGSCIKQWSVNATVDSYISLSTCGDASASTPQIVNGSCDNPSRKYIYCRNGGARFDILNTYNLPSSNMKTMCDQDAGCVGILINKAQDTGSTLQNYRYYESSYFSYPA
jgi:hypothetical protein